jgi:RNA 2',3'-cyclic 3'-phosphodiesterase
MTSDGSTDRFRLFVAIAVPEAVRNEMIRVQRELQPLAPRGMVRWARPEQFHLTLRFLGGVSSDRVADLQKAVRTACCDVPMLPLQAQGVGFFPHARSPRVVWVGINDSDNQLADFQKKIENAVRPFAAEKGSENFAGHVTLGRFKSFNRLTISRLTDAAETMKARQFGDWTVGEVEVVRSELSKIGTVYTKLALCPLRAKN